MHREYIGSLLVYLSPPKEIETNSNKMGVELREETGQKMALWKLKLFLFFLNTVIILSLKPSLFSLAPTLDPIYDVDLAAKSVIQNAGTYSAC